MTRNACDGVRNGQCVVDYVNKEITVHCRMNYSRNLLNNFTEKIEENEYFYFCKNLMGKPKGLFIS
jgi:hypothetical protein